MKPNGAMTAIGRVVSLTGGRCSDHHTKPPAIPEEDGVKQLVKEVNHFFAEFVDTGAAREETHSGQSGSEAR